jgi:hypothetical protein
MYEVSEAFLAKGRPRFAFDFSYLLFFLFLLLRLLFRLSLIFTWLPDIFYLLAVFLRGVVLKVAVQIARV